LINLLVPHYADSPICSGGVNFPHPQQINEAGGSFPVRVRARLGEPLITHVAVWKQTHLNQADSIHNVFCLVAFQ
jgi:hypothetical protein